MLLILDLSGSVDSHRICVGGGVQVQDMGVLLQVLGKSGRGKLAYLVLVNNG